jgi:glutamate dehydrogenase/leucine dehydrogenase
MSNTSASPKPRGRRPRKPARTRHGRAVYAAMDAKGLDIKDVIRLARVSFNAFGRVVHEPDTGILQVRTLVAVARVLGIPLDILAPCTAGLLLSGAPEPVSASA